MKPSPTFESRLEATGTALRDRPSLVELVMAELRQLKVRMPTESDEQTHRS